MPIVRGALFRKRYMHVYYTTTLDGYTATFLDFHSVDATERHDNTRLTKTNDILASLHLPVFFFRVWKYLMGHHRPTIKTGPS